MSITICDSSSHFVNGLPDKGLSTGIQSGCGGIAICEVAQKRKPVDALTLVVRANVQRLLVERQWDDVQLARRSGLTQPHVSMLLSGERGFPLPTIHKIASGFDIDPSDLLRHASAISSSPVPDFRQSSLQAQPNVSEDARHLSNEEGGGSNGSDRSGQVASWLEARLDRVVTQVEARLTDLITSYGEHYEDFKTYVDYLRVINESVDQRLGAQLAHADDQSPPVARPEAPAPHTAPGKPDKRLRRQSGGK